jgi:hypothetical protein
MRPRLALGPWWTCDHGVAQPLRGSGGHRDSLERGRRSSEFSPMTPFGGGVAEIATQRRSTNAVGGAPMGI